MGAAEIAAIVEKMGFEREGFGAWWADAVPDGDFQILIRIRNAKLRVVLWNEAGEDQVDAHVIDVVTEEELAEVVNEFRAEAEAIQAERAEIQAAEIEERKDREAAATIYLASGGVVRASWIAPQRVPGCIEFVAIDRLREWDAGDSVILPWTSIRSVVRRPPATRTL